ncbi:MAG: hypothetical protein LBS50_05395 [Prevotellaceae bacterium]|jgi:hypothetical protein|nr:hypothetical protein [Prevotellaceae bacterium]
MKKHYIFNRISVILLFFVSLTIKAQTVLPSQPFGVTGLSKPTLSCQTLLVGYVNFEPVTGNNPTSWQLSNVDKYGAAGAANQTLATTKTYTASSVQGTNNYSIVKNPTSMGTFQNIDAPGGFFVCHGGNALTYTIRGLNSPADFGITQNDNIVLPLIYYVRIKLHNFGQNGGCNPVGNNIEITFKNPNGNDYSIGNNMFYDANLNRGANGRYMAVNNSLCSQGNVINQSWGGWGQLSVNDTRLGYDNTTTTFEGCWGIGAGRAGQAPFGTDDGFQILIKAMDNNGDNILGIESIEVYGCLPMKMEAQDGLDGTIGERFCENGPVNISATGAGFGANITWYKGEGNTPPTSSTSVGYGNTIHTNAPQGVGNSDLYWAVGNIGGTQVFDTIRIFSIFCCSALGQTNEVFAEHFQLSAPQRICNNETISALAVNPAYSTSTTYTYTTDCSLTEGKYAITTGSHWSFWAGIGGGRDRQRVGEHTGTPNSGAMMINADANTNQFFFTLQLSGLCPNTQYELSAWYVSLAYDDEQSSNITFQIFEGANPTPFETGSTGNFGGNSSISSFVWRKYSIQFTTPASSSISTQYFLKLKNGRGEASGNDLMIDDIVVTKCIPTLYLYENGTVNTSISVCSDDAVSISVDLSAAMLNLISSGNDTVCAQLMSSTNGITGWTAVGALQTISSAGAVVFSITPPATAGVTLYYRVKLSADAGRAANVGLALTNGCYNDVITQTFDITKDGSMGTAANPTATPHSSCGTYKDYYTLVGNTAVDADFWGWAYNDTTGMVFGNTAADKIFVASQNGVYYFVYKKGECKGIKNVTINDIFTNTDIPALTIAQPNAACEGTPLNLTAPTIPSGIPVNAQGWTLNGSPFVSGTVLTAADNGKILKYFASNACDSEQSNEVTLIVGANKDITINQQWCVDTRYNQNGFDITPATEGMITQTLNLYTSLGCDSIVTLNLDVKSTLNETVFDTICSAQLPYTWRGHTFPAGTTDSQQTYNEQTYNGCDSTVIYNLKVFLSEDTQETISICADLLPYTYHAFSDTIFDINTTDGVFVFHSRCSVKTLNLTVSPKVNAENVESQPVICADDASFALTVVPSTTSQHDVPPTHYTVEFLGNALTNGNFSSAPQTGIIGANGEISIAMPASVYPDKYFCNVILTSAAGCNSLIFDNVEFSILYPSSVMQQKWNDVLALLNKYYNGGYEFTGYQWYKNGSALAGENRSYIYLGQGKVFDPNDEYYVELTRNDGTTMLSCPYDIQPPKPEQSTYPTVMAGNNSITVYLTKNNALARLWTTTGILMQSVKVRANVPEREINFPARQGTFLIEILYEDTMERTVVPVVVR